MIRVEDYGEDDEEGVLGDAPKQSIRVASRVAACKAMLGYLGVFGFGRRLKGNMTGIPPWTGFEPSMNAFPVEEV